MGKWTADQRWGHRYALKGSNIEHLDARLSMVVILQLLLGTTLILNSAPHAQFKNQVKIQATAGS